MDVIEFIKTDYRRGLFPLHSTALFAELGSAALKKFIYDEILDPKEAKVSFLPCPIAYALKDRLHLRRTFVLDPIATYFLYDFVIENKKHFQVKSPSKRKMFGYAFKGSEPINAFDDYHKFRRTKYKLKAEFKYFAKVDITNCFNSFYHHDLAEAIESHVGLGASQEFGQFLREINAGTSINCFPQGIYPAKLIGSWFLEFVEKSRQLRSSAIIRFIDDIYFFSDKQAILREDILVLQQILGNHSLSLNSEKTRLGSNHSDFEEQKLDKIKKGLLKKRVKTCPYDGDEEDDVCVKLTGAEKNYLRDLIGNKIVEEEDVELALSLIRDDPETNISLTKLVLKRFPHLLKPLHGLVGSTPGHDVKIWGLLEEKLAQQVMTEHELFWLARIVLDHYEITSHAVDFLLKLYNHPSSTLIVKAAILECESMEYGLEELKVSALRQQPTSLIGIASLAGLRNMGKGKRNQLYKYTAKTSRHMALLCRIMSTS